MNSTFSIQRFGLLLKRQWLEFGKIYLISLVVVFGVITSFYFIMLWRNLTITHNFEGVSFNFRTALFLILGFLFITVIASSYFAQLGQKSRAIIDLMVPASVFEKFVGGLFFTTILAPASFFLLFYLTDLVIVSYINNNIEYHTLTSFYENGKIEKLNYIQYYFNTNKDIFYAIYSVPFFIISLFLLGSIYFERFHYIKTIVSVMLFSGIATAIIAKSAKILFEGRIPIETQSTRYFKTESSAEFATTLLLWGLTLIFWSITYVRLKEKEV